MLNKTGFFVINSAEVESVITERKQGGWRIFRLPVQILSKDDFFEGVRRTLPLDPPLQSNRSWDALADSLWAGLGSIQEGRIVVVWPQASRMEKCAPEDFSIAKGILEEFPDTLADVEMMAGSTKELLILLGM